MTEFRWASEASVRHTLPGPGSWVTFVEMAYGWLRPCKVCREQAQAETITAVLFLVWRSRARYGSLGCTGS